MVIMIVMLIIILNTYGNTNNDNAVGNFDTPYY